MRNLENIFEEEETAREKELILAGIACLIISGILFLYKTLVIGWA